MKPITLVVEDHYKLYPGDYLIVTSETNFIHVLGSIEPRKVVDNTAPQVKVKKKPNRPRKYIKRGRKNPKMPTREELELRRNRILDNIIKYPNKTVHWHNEKSGLEGTRFNSVLRQLIALKLVTCSYMKNGRINAWKPVVPAQ